MIQRIQRLRDNIKIIEEMSDNVRLTAESTLGDAKEEPAEHEWWERVVNAGETD